MATTCGGTDGDDILYSEAGNDTYRGGAGDDTLYDSQGKDAYTFAWGDGADTILDTHRATTR
ncbi:MAG: hypothetical protein LBR95_06955 [Azoarcus sp.]|jgi:Ca2+-binding RTX toxin-like protein|nr:hypothetical protein [Azoarcus sp.]